MESRGRGLSAERRFFVLFVLSVLSVLSVVRTAT